MPVWAAVLLALLTPAATVAGVAFFFGGQKEKVASIEESHKRLHALVEELAKESAKQALESAKRTTILERVQDDVKKLTSDWPQVKLDIELIKRTTSRRDMPAVRPGSYSGREPDK